MKKTTLTMAGLAVILVIAGCAAMPSAEQLDQQTLAMLKASFRSEGIATTDRLDQDLGQKACSSAQAPA
ncbi:sulfur oxidation c-type cytochrome SoxX, partial [Roseateles sp. GG27B]